MGNYLQAPALRKDTHGGDGPGFKWGGSAMQGWRNDMEDAHIMMPEMCDRLKTFSFFTVFDGHSGKAYAEKVAREFVPFLLERKPFDTLKDGDEYDIEELKETIKQAFLDYDTEAKNDVDIMRQHAGCTATGVMITPKHVVFYNIGDSRSFIVRGESEILFTTSDHKPNNAEEKARIERGGGRVQIGRVNGMLAVSRALGDFELKNNSNLKQTEQLVSAEADVSHVERDDTDNFIMICCDGIFDVQKNEELSEYITDRLPCKYDLKILMEELVDYCCFKGSKDNMSAIVIHFNASPLPLGKEPEAKEELEWNTTMKNHVKEYVLEKTKEGRSAYNWDNCYRTLQDKFPLMFDKVPEKYGRLVLKKGVLYAEFLYHTDKIQEDRAKQSRERMLQDTKRREDLRQKRIANGEQSSEDEDYSDFI